MAKPIQNDEQYSEEEAQRRLEAALRGARIVGHKHQSEMKLGKPRSITPKRPRNQSGGKAKGR